MDGSGRYSPALQGIPGTGTSGDNVVGGRVATDVVVVGYVGGRVVVVVVVVVGRVVVVVVIVVVGRCHHGVVVVVGR